PLRRRLRGRSQRCRWSEGRGPRGIRTSKARTGLRTRLACHRRWSVYGSLCRHTPETGAVCGKAARTDLGGGRAVKRTSPPLQRRAFITLLGGAAAWPLAARAQQSERMRRIAVLVGLAENDPEMKERLAGLRQGLEKLGWAEGRNLRIDYRFAPAGAQARLLARELIALHPDLILAQSTPATAAMQQETRTIPIVFAGVADPIGSGFAASLSRPGGNLTGLLQYEE